MIKLDPWTTLYPVSDRLSLSPMKVSLPVKTGVSVGLLPRVVETCKLAMPSRRLPPCTGKILFIRCPRWCSPNGVSSGIPA